MNTATQNLTITQNQPLTTKYTRIVQKDWLRKIELKALNEQFKMHMNTNAIIQKEYTQAIIKTSKAFNMKGMQYIFPGVVVLLSVIILM